MGREQTMNCPERSPAQLGQSLRRRSWPFRWVLGEQRCQSPVCTPKEEAPQRPDAPPWGRTHCCKRGCLQNMQLCALA